LGKKWQLIGFVQASNYRKEVLKALNEPSTPNSLEKKLNIKISHISRTIKELIEKKLVKCHTPELRKGKIFEITKEGKEILKDIK